MIVCDLARAPLVAAIPLLHAAGALSLGVLVALALAIGLFAGPHLASQRALLPELLGLHQGAVMRANAALQAAGRLPVVLGPALAGVLIAAVGASNVLLADAVTSLASAGLVVGPVPGSSRPPLARPPTGMWSGVRYLSRDPVLRPAVVAATGLELAAQALPSGCCPWTFTPPSPPAACSSPGWPTPSSRRRSPRWPPSGCPRTCAPA